MFFSKRLWLLFLFVFLFSYQTLACSLPAEPSAAIVPINPSGNGMELVTEGNTFFYLVPQDTTCNFKVVWDPAAHNTGGSLQGDKYDWVTKAGIGFEPGTDKPNGYGYFPAQAMADFFEVQGKGNVKEAFSRATGVSTSNNWIPSLMGPYATLSEFAKPGQQSEISTIGGTASEYPDEGLCPITGMVDSPVEPSIDNSFPDSGLMTDQIPIDFAGNMIDVYKVSADRAVVITGTGLLIEDMDIKLTDIEVTDYKAFIRTGNEAAKIEVESTPAIPWLADGAAGTPGPSYSIRFFIPSFNGTKEDSKIRFKVWAPGAGFEITNIYWVWKEKVYKKGSETQVTTPAVLDADGNEVTPEIKTTKTVWTFLNDSNCSEELKLKVIKPAAEAGSTDFIVYDTKGPIASKFTTTPSDKGFEATGETTMNYSLEILDTNPYFDQFFNTSISGVTLKQSLANLELQVYYTYPCYEYTAAAGLGMDGLKTGGYGLADLTGQPQFKSYKYETKWVWKKADATVTGITSCTQKNGSSGKLAGAVAKVEGSITIKQPRPWHECNDGSAAGFSTPEPKFKILAISKDTAGLPCMLYSDVAATGDTLVSETANPEAGDPVNAFNPGTGDVIPEGELASKVIGSGIDTSRWSNLAFMKAKDEIAPEIQVVVFDTRTNKYHLFGTKQNVDGLFSNFGGNAFSSDYSAGAIPYLGKEGDISNAHKFTDIADLNGLFDDYLNGPPLSTVTDDSQKGFVCQKNNRLVFYIRAFDNINTCDAGKKFGVSSINYTISDKDGSDAGVVDPLDMMKAIEHVYRFENVVDGALGAPYELSVTAEDFSGNSRELKLAIAVMGRKLEIRTLEERRKRFED